MIEKIRTVTNPLTIIAIFAGLAEVSGSAVLPFLNPSAQDRYIYFLMIFPVLLITFFFLILWNKHAVLYAPGDYRDETNFNAHVSSASVAEIRLNRLQAMDRAVASNAEVTDVSELPTADLSRNTAHETGPNGVREEPQVSQKEDPASPIEVASAAHVSVPDEPLDYEVFRGPTRQVELRRRVLLGEELALSAYQAEIDRPVQRNVKINGANRLLIFDGAVVERDRFNAIDVKFIPANSVWQRRVDAFVEQMSSTYLTLPDDLRKGFSSTLLLVLDRGVAFMQKPSADEIQNRLFHLPFPVTFKMYDFMALERGAGLAGVE